MKKLSNYIVKSLVVILGVISLTAISCKQSDKNQPSKSEIESKNSNESKVSKESKESTTTPTKTGFLEKSSIPQPTGLSATALAPTVIKLTWNKVPNATTYWIYRDNYVPAIIPGTNYTDSAVKAGTTYNYTIAAVVSSTLGPKSSSVTATTPR